MQRIQRPEALETDLVLEFTVTSRGWATPHQLWAVGTHGLSRAVIHLVLSCESLGRSLSLLHSLLMEEDLRSPAHRLTCLGDICSETQWKEGSEWEGHPGSWGRAVQGGSRCHGPEKGASREEQGRCGEPGEGHPYLGARDEQGLVKCWGMAPVGLCWVKHGQRESHDCRMSWNQGLEEVGCIPGRPGRGCPQATLMCGRQGCGYSGWHLAIWGT